jgi:hypothetical protein
MSRSPSTIAAYRVAIDDLRDWADCGQRASELFEEATMVNYLDDYRRRCSPAAATYHRRFLLLRRSCSGSAVATAPRTRSWIWMNRPVFLGAILIES